MRRGHPNPGARRHAGGGDRVRGPGAGLRRAARPKPSPSTHDEAWRWEDGPCRCGAHHLIPGIRVRVDAGVDHTRERCDPVCGCCPPLVYEVGCTKPGHQRGAP